MNEIIRNDLSAFQGFMFLGSSGLILLWYLGEVVGTLHDTVFIHNHKLWLEAEALQVGPVVFNEY